MYEYRIGITASIAATTVFVLYLLISPYYTPSSYDLVVIPTIILTVIPIGVSIWIWYTTTKTPRENRDFVRRKLARSYEDMAARADHMRMYINADQIGEMREIYGKALHTMEIHASSMPADEIESANDWWESLDQGFLVPLEENPHNADLLAQLAKKVSNHKEAYIAKYKISNYRGYPTMSS